MGNSRDALRAATLGKAKHFQKRLVTLPDGAKIEIRQPTVAARAAIFKAAKAASGDRDKLEIGALQVEAVMRCAFDPESGDRVFEEGDREDLMSQPAGGWVDELSNVALDLLNVDAKEIEKNSAGTPNGN